MKFAHYRRLDGLQEYLVVSRDRPRVERHVRPGAAWELTEFDGLDAVLEFASFEGAVPLSRVYNRVPLPDNPGR